MMITLTKRFKSTVDYSISHLSEQPMKKQEDF